VRDLLGEDATAGDCQSCKYRTRPRKKLRGGSRGASQGSVWEERDGIAKATVRTLNKSRRPGKESLEAEAADSGHDKEKERNHCEKARRDMRGRG